MAGQSDASGSRDFDGEAKLFRVHEKIYTLNNSQIKPYSLAFSCRITQIDVNGCLRRIFSGAPLQTSPKGRVP